MVKVKDEESDLLCRMHFALPMKRRHSSSRLRPVQRGLRSPTIFVLLSYPIVVHPVVDLVLARSRIVAGVPGLLTVGGAAETSPGSCRDEPLQSGCGFDTLNLALPLAAFHVLSSMDRYVNGTLTASQLSRFRTARIRSSVTRGFVQNSSGGNGAAAFQQVEALSFTPKGDQVPDAKFGRQAVPVSFKTVNQTCDSSALMIGCRATGLKPVNDCIAPRGAPLQPVPVNSDVSCQF